ncbi:type III-B CRISPR module-associated protein Cmr5 [Paenibacillus sp. YYML68]|uniref:type III-B CRISPR module-associated protein Cmr5 n=1 Tax=Paenibacillus sp. YYML68 TaxID=2909250 RepID=UPI0024934140|nr:type III-B CRISPR module-associated protein Cmr5 [Paenibacillus sp. YYML68]
MKSREHHYSEVAYRAVAKIASKDPGKLEEYKRVCHSFPAYIQTNGLRLAVAYFEKKSSECAYKCYLNDMGEALRVKAQDGTSHPCQPLSTNRLPSNFTAYRRMTMEALKAATWFKRYAEAYHMRAQSSSVVGKEENADESAPLAD